MKREAHPLYKRLYSQLMIHACFALHFVALAHTHYLLRAGTATAVSCRKCKGNILTIFTMVVDERLRKLTS